MTIDELAEKSADELEKMTDAEIKEFFKDVLKFCIPSEETPKIPGGPITAPPTISKRSKAESRLELVNKMQKDLYAELAKAGIKL